jgi:hypothetical protein
MQDVSLFFEWGWGHIISRDALDHLLFIAALAVVFQLDRWKEVLVLVTAFTIGHFITLWLSVTGAVELPAEVVESVIPMTIVITAAVNMLRLSERFSIQIHYILALAFGLIHGLGYANTLRFSLTDGQSIGWALLGFNIGLELGQLLVVALMLTAGAAITRIGIKKLWWEQGVSALIFVRATLLAIERFP